MRGVDEVVADRWWSAEGCRPVALAESVYRYLWETVFERAPLSTGEARVLAAIVTGLDPEDDVGVATGDLAAACAVPTYTVEAVLDRLARAGLVRRVAVARDRAARRLGWAYRLSAGLVRDHGGPSYRITPRYDAERGFLGFHAVRDVPAA